jgi:uncharacterized repeat protein (TIGR03803 family)
MLSRRLDPRRNKNNRRHWVMRNLRLGRVSALIAAVLTVATLAPQSGASAVRLKTLYSFCAQENCTDGSEPGAGVIMDAAGHLYGTTATGGNAGPYVSAGTVFELTPNAAKTKWTETVLYSFCAQGGTSCTDGDGPAAGLIRDAAGNLYGTTTGGGAHAGPSGSGEGTVFELSPDATGTWTETVLYSFCAQENCTDGDSPEASLIRDAAGNLYGTTPTGGAHAALGNGGGTVFELTRNAAKATWTEKVLYSFCASSVAVLCSDGAGPAGGLIRDAAGNLYGTTEAGGASGSDTVFQLIPNAAKSTWTHKILYSFCPQFGCTDGQGGALMPG